MLQALTGYLEYQTIRLIRYTGELSLLLCQTVYLCFVPPFKTERILSQCRRVGPGSFFIASLVSFFIGMILALQMAYQMVKLSAELYIPGLVGVALCREMAPVLSALIVTGRIGAGITAEIGSMKVTEQVDALRAFAVNPIKFLVVPRFIALVLMLPALTIFADFIGILGGYVICVFKLDISNAMFWHMIIKTIDPPDIFTGLIKTIFFGAIIALVGCRQGLSVSGGAEGVGRATTLSVVISFILIIMADGLFTTIFNYILRL
jgi:phospholipid/cholesterol/gamma-HCH transport system permease protein